MRVNVTALLLSALAVGCGGELTTPSNGSAPDAGGGGAGAGGGGGDASTGNNGDTFLPWAGGAAYYARWSHGPPSDNSFLPISVWLQTPSNATRYRQVGINFFTGLYQGPTESQLSTLASASMPTIC